MIIKNCPANTADKCVLTGRECAYVDNLCTIKKIVLKCRESWGGRDTCNFQNHILKILDVRD